MNRREAIKRTALLLGVAVSPSGITSALAQIARDPTASAKYLSPLRFATATAIAEVILPRTDTIGAIDAGVPQFIDASYGTFLQPEEQTTLEFGLDTLEASAETQHRKSFAKLTSAQQESLLRAIADDKQSDQRTFLRKMRELTLLGYFTAERVAKEVMVWDPVPGMDIPCQDLSVTNGVAYFE